MYNNYIKTSEACKQLNVTRHTLRRWYDEGKIEVFRAGERGNMKYNVKKFMIDSGMTNIKNICYCNAVDNNELENQIFENTKKIFPKIFEK